MNLNFIDRIRQNYANPLDLFSYGIMGMNQRNVSYIGRYNKRRLYPLVDNKLKTKQMAIAHGVTTPTLLGAVKNQVDAQNILEESWAITVSSASSRHRALAARAFWLLQAVTASTLPRPQVRR